MTATDNVPEAFYPPPSLRPDRLKVIISHDKEYAFRRPPVPGKAIEYVFIPAMGFMRGKVIKKGQVIRIIDLEGQQAVDTIIWDANDLYNVQFYGATQMLNKKWNYWRPGDALFSKNCDKLATITEDTTDGIHYAGTFCNERENYVRYGIPGTPNCRDNFVAAMAHYEFSAQDLDYASCFSYFTSFTYNPDGTRGIGIAPSKSGDYIDLMAERDIIIAISNCPSIRSATNNYDPTSTMAVIFNPNDDYKAMANTLPKPSTYRMKEG